MSREDSNNYRQIFLSDAPMIDLRAPCEFVLGAFPTSINLPLMSDLEREKVGICYKKHGQEAAIKLGHDLVKDQNKGDKVSLWQTFANANKENGYFYCFRGGLRSRTSQQWLSESGLDFPIIKGGYKAMRRFLIDETERLVNETEIVVVSGLTGSAKTKFLKTQNNSIDLEGLANHRGSSFGRNITPQPTQIDFENKLAIDLLKFENSSEKVLLLEDESRLIGSRSLPLSLKNKMDQSNIVMIEESFKFRVSQIYNDYVVNMMNDFEVYSQTSSDDNKDTISIYQEYLESSTLRIKRRLGGVGLKEMMDLIERAIENQRKNDDLSLHKNWIIYLLKNYYDPMYEYQVGKKMERVIFKGNTSAVSEYISTM
ncbi:MAG: tRNA 2-selenouridine(34) synthase MnmH [Kangiella sp.]|nr:MAG: tRNA 2-selenouridine(34) synthase MnmH [Kangiella sp.]